MTDEEMKRIEHLAKERDLYALAYEVTPETLLALIERVRKAERKGAEEMREASAQAVEQAPASFNRNDHAERIRRLDLP